jgi:hypothetical protein
MPLPLLHLSQSGTCTPAWPLCTVLFGALLFFAGTELGQAQSRLVIEPGPPGHINQVIHNDVNSAGQRNDPNRIYVLRRGAVYLYTEQIINQGYHLTIEAEDGTGAKPVLQAAAPPGGAASPRPFRPEGNLTLRGLYLYGHDDLGRVTDNAMVRNRSTGGRIIIEDCHFDGNRLTALQTDNNNAKFYVRNSVFSHIHNLGNPDGWVINNNAEVIDSLVVVNNTFYNNDGYIILNAPGRRIEHIHFEHNTFVNTGAAHEWYPPIGTGWTREFVFKNNLVYNQGYYGLAPGDTLASGEPRGMIGIVTVPTDDETEPEAVIEFRNNTIYFDPAIASAYPATHSVRQVVEGYLRGYLEANPWFLETVIWEDPNFLDAPSTASVIAFLQHYYQHAYTNNPPFLDKDPRANMPAIPPAV